MGTPVATGLQRVAELVGQQGREEERGGRQRHGHVGLGGQIRAGGREDRGGERPDDQGDDQQPRPVGADLDACDATEAKR